MLAADAGYLEPELDVALVGELMDRLVARWGDAHLEGPRYDLESARQRAEQSAPPAVAGLTDLEAIGVTRDDVQGLDADGPGGAEDGEPLHGRSAANT